MKPRPERKLNLNLPIAFEGLSLGGWVILCIAILSTLAVALREVPKRDGLEFWVFAMIHYDLYEDYLEERNKTEDPDVDVYLVQFQALSRRMMAGFLSDLPVADLVEFERQMAAQAFTGPLEDVGFIDLTDRLHEEGLYEQINEPSFGPWTSRGRIFGIPHDVHPMMLAYRADLVEAAGIDVRRIETWDDFARELRPLIQDLDGDGRPDRYLLSLWENSISQLEALLLQAGGYFFDENESLDMCSEANVRVAATVVSWMVGPDRMAADAPEFSASGNKLRIDGYVVASLAPDWLCSVHRRDMPSLAGRYKLMPLPAWEPGGRRTSVWGGTMLGLTKSTLDPETTWDVAKDLYLSTDVAERLFQKTYIISPVKALWDAPFYHQSDPFFSNQRVGEMYIELAPQVPARTSSPFNQVTLTRFSEVIMALRRYAIDEEKYAPEELTGEALRLLQAKEDEVRRQIERNVFLREAP